MLLAHAFMEATAKYKLINTKKTRLHGFNKALA
jgi:hypothetical protein